MQLKQRSVGVALVLAGLAQIAPGLRPVDGARSWLLRDLSAAANGRLAGFLWAVAMLGLVAAGFDLLGLTMTRVRWRPIAAISLASSALLLGSYWPVYSVVAALVDLAALALVLRWRGDVRDAQRASGRASHRVARVAALAFLVYLAAAVCLRPWYIRWGSSEREERLPLPAADAVTPEPSFQTTRSILIDAPPADVWKWIVQLGQDRAGYYSYDWLERLVGFGVHNTNRIVPEWQHRSIGEFVRAAPPTMFGGLFGPNVGFRVAVFDPNRTFVLTSRILNWSFVLESIDEHHTRLIVRARGDANPGLKNYVLSLLDFFAVGPAHFIMEHKLLMTLKERSETRREPLFENAGGPVDRIVWSFVALTTICSAGHHFDHASRGLIGWPLNHHVTPFTYGLGFYVLIIVGSLLSRRGVLGPGFWAVLAAAGLLFIGGSHYGPFANDPPSGFAAAYGSQIKAAFALAWLWLFLLSLAGAMVYCGMRWAMLRRRS